MISVSVRLPKIGDIRPGVKKSIWQSAVLVRRDATKRAPYQTGTLRRSIIEKVRGTEATVGTNLVYARIHEYGGIIKPKKAKRLVFMKGGKLIFAKQVRIKKQPYLRPALKAMKDKITKIFAKNLSTDL